jgi:hypothetical protein
MDETAYNFLVRTERFELGFFNRWFDELVINNVKIDRLAIGIDLLAEGH